MYLAHSNAHFRFRCTLFLRLPLYQLSLSPRWVVEIKYMIHFWSSFLSGTNGVMYDNLLYVKDENRWHYIFDTLQCIATVARIDDNWKMNENCEDETQHQ